ncbi:hypothetical protein [Halomarina pelagica]|uniref:hypothetical protein n=1 Tax=Halomarina pelagica TaxID=2961599 RepID=UPI0020C51FB7|nr:hypothetical protein [Halomarina sp. BND7]
MTSGSFSERTWHPESLTGLVMSTVSTYVLAALFWWVGIGATRESLATLSTPQYAGGIVLGSILSVRVLSIHARPVWRERWRTSVRLRLVAALPIAIGLGLLVSFAPAVASLGFVVLAVVFTLGRIYLYLTA